jgi:hypothetical protein
VRAVVYVQCLRSQLATHDQLRAVTRVRFRPICYITPLKVGVGSELKSFKSDDITGFLRHSPST